MCVSPLQIKNPNFGLGTGYNYKGKYTQYKHIKNHLIDYKCRYINVPCGHCPECISRKQTDIIQRCEVEARQCWVYFATLTYNEDTIPKYDLDGHLYKYADVKDLQCMLKRLRNENVFGVPFKYLAVSERGSKKHRPHFHVLFFFKKSDIGDIIDARNFGFTHKFTCLHNWKRNIGDRNHVEYVNLCDFHQKRMHGRVYKNYDFHFVEPALSKHGCCDVAYYVSSYVMKGSALPHQLKYALECNYESDVAAEAYKVLKDKCIKSIGFGVTDESESIVRESIDSAIGADGYAKFYLSNGRGVPLARYYRKKYFTLSDQEKIYKLAHPEGGANINYLDPARFNNTHYDNTMISFERKRKMLADKSFFNFLS